MAVADEYRYHRLTWEEMNDAIAAQKVVVLPTGSTEQHGPHLPLDVDAFLVESVCLELGRRAADRVLVLPTVSFGLNRHHIDFPGTIGIAWDNYVRFLLDIVKSVAHHGFKKVLIGLSGGIDSSLVATVAVDALGKENVVGVAMPSRFSSSGSLSDASLLAKNLGIKLYIISIEPAFKAYLEMLSDAFKGTEPSVAEENMQARVRGNILMALSNKFGWLVLNTGNKSELATGYTTLYGDMAGGFAVIKDMPKTMVYEMTKYRNSRAEFDLVPTAIIDKVPSAELRPNQKDSDTLPLYEVLDQVITAYVEEDKSIEQSVAMGIPEEVVKRAARLVDNSEYKRRQAPPGIKITPRAFGRDRRLPITNRFKG
jgi:NAD+ synthase (glutamine-hydrolysing)